MQLIITRKFTPRNSKLSTIQTQMNSMLYLRTLAAVNDLFHFAKWCPLLPDCLIRELCTYWEIKARHFAAAAVIPYLVKFNYIVVLYKQTAKIELVLALCTLTLEIFSLNWVWFEVRVETTDGHSGFIWNVVKEIGTSPIDYCLCLQWFSSDRVGNGGGVEIYVKSQFCSSMTCSISKAKQCELLAVQVNISKDAHFTVIGGYRPPFGH